MFKSVSRAVQCSSARHPAVATTWRTGVCKQRPPRTDKCLCGNSHVELYSLSLETSAMLHSMQRGERAHPHGKEAPIVTTRRLTLRHCRRETEKQAHAPRYRGRKPGAKSFELHLLERARRSSVRRVRWLWPEAWAAWPAWMQNEDPWQPQHVLCTIDRHYALLTAQLRKRPFYVHVDLKTWKSSANVSCRLVRQRLWRGFYSV